MPTVSLWENYHDFIALLIPAPSGIKFSNQVGGTACAHPEIEGVCIPLPGRWLEGTPDHHLPFYDMWPREYNAEDVTKFLAACPELAHKFEPPTPEEVATLGVVPADEQMSEAWVPVKVRGGVKGMLKELRGRVGILTYSNSD